MTLDTRWVELVREVQVRAPIRPGPLSWQPSEIVLTKGCDARPHEAAYCERVIAAFPSARVTDARDTPHNRVRVPGHTALERIDHGKRMLVLGRMGKPVSRNEDPEADAGTLCTHYNAVHPSWFCFYNCAFCYLSGSPGVRFSPTVRLFTNLLDILDAMQTALDRAPGTVSFYVGKIQDGLQLDPIANFTRVLVPFVRAHANAHLVFLTKSAAVDGLIEAFAEVEGPGQVVASWSLNPPEIATDFEWGAPPFEARLDAARRCADAGIEVRFIFMPLVPIDGWREIYAEAIRRAMHVVRPSRVTTGGICSYPSALSDTAGRLGDGNIITRLANTKHGRRMRYPPDLRAEMYRFVTAKVQRSAPGVPVSLCLESAPVWRSAGLDPARCRCNCIAGSCDLVCDGAVGEL